MQACEVCLDLDWDLYPLSKAVNVELDELESSASQGCIPCRIIHHGVELMEGEVILPAGGRSHADCPVSLQITLRKDQSLVVEVRSFDDTAASKNYGLDLEFFSAEGERSLIAA